MTLTAEVIVDVPTMQTDQPFTYLVPSEMETALQVGMRVEVPLVMAIVMSKDLLWLSKNQKNQLTHR